MHLFFPSNNKQIKKPLSSKQGLRSGHLMHVFDKFIEMIQTWNIKFTKLHMQANTEPLAMHQFWSSILFRLMENGLQDSVSKHWPWSSGWSRRDGSLQSMCSVWVQLVFVSRGVAVGDEVDIMLFIKRIASFNSAHHRVDCRNQIVHRSNNNRRQRQ